MDRATDLLPWLNLLLPPLLVYVVRIENRITRLETQRQTERESRAEYWREHGYPDRREA